MWFGVVGYVCKQRLGWVWAVWLGGQRDGVEKTSRDGSDDG